MNADTEEAKKKTIVIFGVSGFVGSNIAEFLKKDYRVIGTYYNNPIEIPGVVTVPCDILKKDEVQLVLFAFRPDISIYAVGLSSVVTCSDKADSADALNTVGLINLVEYCQRYKSQVCYISSGFVFSGEKKDYIEMDIPDSNTIYGKTVAASEFYIQKTSLNYVIFRTCRLYGRSPNSFRNTLFETLQSKFRKGRPFSCDTKVKTGYLDVQYLAMLIDICFKKESTNRLFQISSHDSSSFYDFSKNYAEVFNEQLGLLSKGTFPFPIKFSNSESDELYYQMDITNIENYLNIRLPTIRESIEFTYKRFFGIKDKDSQSDEITFI